MAPKRRSHALTHDIAIAVLVLVGLSGPLATEAWGQEYARADIEHGLRLYGENCTRCHGPDGNAVTGVNLRAGQFRNASNDTELIEIIMTGIPGTAMPAGAFSPSELAGLVAYLRSMSEVDARGVTLGDAGRGRTLFEGKAECSGCHRINGVGPRAAPDLSRIGALRTAGALEQTLVDPTGSMRPVNRPVRVVTRDGAVVTGRRVNEDSYSVQLVADDARLVSFDKAALREYTVLTTSPMPSATDTLNGQELADVVAYLLTLKGLE